MKTKIAIGLLLAFCFSLSMLKAQELKPTKTFIRYKDGSIFSGQIIKESKYEIILLVATGDTLYIEKKNVDRIHRMVQGIIDSCQ